MVSLNPVNLIQAASIAVCILGAAILWPRQQVRGIAWFMLLVALAAAINILEESGVTRRFYLISPSFQLLFGPVMYFACCRLIGSNVAGRLWWHLIPGLLALIASGSAQWLIALGTISRLVYALLIAKILYRYNQQIDNERSDSEEFSFMWMIGLVGVTALFNLVDLVRLNMQPVLPVEVNLIGQGINNLWWLVVIMVLTYQLQRQKDSPKPEFEVTTEQNRSGERVEDYQSIYDEIDSVVAQHQWYRKERLTLSGLAQLTGLQSRDVSRAINLVGQKSFNEYVNAHRVQYVCEQLSSASSQSLNQIAFDAGFSSKATFNKTFKQFKGQTPSEFRKQQKR